MTMGRIAALLILASMAMRIWVRRDMRREPKERAAAPGGGPPTA